MTQESEEIHEQQKTKDKPLTKKYTWKEVKDIIKTSDLSLLRRNQEQEKDYQKFRSQLRKEWTSVLDYILVTKFDWRKEITDAKQWTAISPQDRYETRLVLCRNDFPYYMESNIDHWILWKLDGRSGIGSNLNTITNNEIEQAKIDLCANKDNRFEDRNVKILDILHWINPPHLKSLPDIDHVHILTLRQ